MEPTQTCRWNDLRLQILAPAAPAQLGRVDAGLDDHNARCAALQDVRPLHVIAEDPRGRVAGGAIGRSWGACCELQQLWVEEARRGQGLGRALMAAFEQKARARGCERVYLDSFSFQAPDFYARLGYAEVLRIEGYSGGVVKRAMHKRLAAAPLADRQARPGELLRAYLAAYARRDLGAIEAMLAEAVTLQDWNLRVAGRAAVLAETRRNFEAARSISITIRSLFEQEDAAAAELEIVVDDTIRLRVVDVLRFDAGGRIRAIEAYKG